MKMINKHNAGDYLLDLVDGELTDADQKKLLQYIEQHPELKTELKLLQKTKLKPEKHIHFPDKSTLFSQNMKPKKAVLINWKKVSAVIAAAACLLFILLFYFHQKPLSPGTGPKHISIAGKAPASIPQVISPVKRPHHALQIPDSVKARRSPTLASVKPFTKRLVNHPSAIQNKKATKGTPPKTVSAVAVSSAQIHPLPHEAPLADVKMGERLKDSSQPLVPEVALQKQRLITPSKSESNEGLNPLQQFQKSKNELDSTVTDKLYALQDKIKHPLKKVFHIKEIKIGSLSFVFNH